MTFLVAVKECDVVAAPPLPEVHVIRWRKFHLDRLLRLRVERSGAGTDLRALPTRKCPEVSTSMPSSGAESSGVRGLLLRNASISTVTEYSSSINRL